MATTKTQSGRQASTRTFLIHQQPDSKKNLKIVFCTFVSSVTAYSQHGSRHILAFVTAWCLRNYLDPRSRVILQDIEFRGVGADAWVSMQTAFEVLSIYSLEMEKRAYEAREMKQAATILLSLKT